MANKSQIYSESCGAVALLCAAIELGKTKLPTISSSMCDGRTLATNDYCESALYHITSGLLDAGTAVDPLKPAAVLGTAGISLPHNVVAAATHLGLTSDVYVGAKTNPYLAMFLSVYPDAVKDALSASITVNYLAPPTVLTGKQRMLKVMLIKPIKGGGAHYILERPGGGCMNPDGGMDFTDFTKLNTNKGDAYIDTGIAIRVSS